MAFFQGRDVLMPPRVKGGVRGVVEAIRSAPELPEIVAMEFVRDIFSNPTYGGGRRLEPEEHVEALALTIGALIWMMAHPEEPEEPEKIETIETP